MRNTHIFGNIAVPVPISSDFFMISGVVFFLIFPVVHMLKGTYKNIRMIAHFISKQLATTATFFPPFFDKGIIVLNDLQFAVDNLRSYESTKQEGPDTNFLAWTALRSSIINMTRIQ